MISSPCLVLIVTFVILSLPFGCSGVGSGHAGASCCVVVRRCFAELPSTMSSATCLLGGDGIACLLWQLVGAVAIRKLASAGVVVTIGVSSMALGGSCGPPFACAGVDVVCSACV